MFSRVGLFLLVMLLPILATAEDQLLENTRSGEELLERAFGIRTIDDLTPQIKRRMVRVLVSTNEANFVYTAGQLWWF